MTPTPDPLPPGLPTATVLGHRMVLNPPHRDRFITPSLVRAGCFEPVQTEWVLNTVRPGDVALDIGAHVGYYTLLLAALVGPAGRVLAFEPDPDNFALLRHNVALNGYANVEVYPYAAADKAGRCRLYRSADNAGDHRLHPGPEPRPAVEVEAATVDDVLCGRVERVDFVKMDVQGSEGWALEGMAGVLGRSPRVTLVCEFWPEGLAQAGYGAERLLDRVRGLGFRMYEVGEADGTIRRADPAGLFTRYPGTDDRFTNLWCVKAPLYLPSAARRR